jgi:outer membrane protein assembly factor BamB
MRSTLITALLCVFTSALSAANWPQWRGPNFDGSSSETGLPTKFSTNENVKWTAELKGPSASTPIVYDDRVFLNSTDQAERKLVAVCLDRVKGTVVWEKTVSEAYDQDPRSNYSSPSPATDGKIVVFFCGNGALAAYDFAGKELWTRNIQKEYGPFAFQWTFSTSPLLYDGRLYLQVLQRDKPANGRGNKEGPNESYLLALDPKTGKELWKVIRASEAREESREAFTTPIPYTQQGRSELLVAGGDCISGHDPETGRELWRWGTWNPTRIPHWRLVPSPVAGADTILACAPKKSPIYALKAGLSGTQDDSALRWTSAERGPISSDVSTPLFYKGSFFIVNSDEKTISRVEPQSGKILWTGEFPSRVKIEASPTAADDKIYVMDHKGVVSVIATGDKFEILHRAPFATEDRLELRSSIAIAQRNLFIRSDKKLYCIGQ